MRVLVTGAAGFICGNLVPEPYVPDEQSPSTR
jgi:hypothetical protein